MNTHVQLGPFRGDGGYDRKLANWTPERDGHDPRWRWRTARWL